MKDISSLGNCYGRSPNAGNSNNVRNVNPTGNINNNNANNSNGVAPDCEISQIKVGSSELKSVHSRRERLSSSEESSDKTRVTDAVSDLTGTAIHSTSIKEEVISFKNLYRAIYICKKNVMWKDSVAGFVKNGLINAVKLHDELDTNTYKISAYNVFLVHEKKERIIVSTRMRDRVVQRSLCDNYLTEALSRSFIHDNYACQVGKGTDYARSRLTCHLQRFYRKHGLNGYVLKLDIHDYFGQTSHEVAKRAISKRLDDEWAKQMVYNIIDSFDHLGGEVGMGLGSQITQLVQLAVLDDLDHHIKEKLHIEGYGRYMDDFILIHEDKEYLKKCRDTIISKLAEMGLQVNTKKTFIQPINKPIQFLGFTFRLTSTGKVVMIPLRKKVNKEKRKLKKMVRKKNLEKSHIDECYKSWRSHVGKGNTHELLRVMDEYYNSLYKKKKKG